MASTRNGDAARAAALQAEFNEKKWVWVPDTKEGYLAGWVNQELEEDDAAEVVMSSGGEIRKVPFDSLFKMNPPKFDRVEDIADLTFLNEASVVHNLRLRYGSGAIYTYSGLFLVAINPYQHLPLYSDAIVQQYRGKRRDENPPHIFEVAERAWVNMGDERENQSILITGESGAGKTESTKKVIQYLAAIAADAHPPPPTTPSRTHSRSATLASSSILTSMPTGLGRKKGHSSSNSISATPHLTAKGRLGLLERQILEANPILEAFGNAQTQRNNNSSRFGKFVRIMFSPDGSIAGANIDWYLLEKSRVVYRNEAERSFHVFYQLLAGASDSIKESLLLEGAVADYEYLNKSRREVDGVDDREEWYTLKDALDTVGFSQNEQHELFRIIAAILHIGNIEITSSRGDEAMMPDPSQAERVCHLLGIPIAEFTRAVLRPRTLAGREWVSQSRTQQQALDELSALCKTLYEKSFGALVDRINKALDRPSSKANFIGVLDIAGFEIFDVNSYEQLLINYTNEKLQQFFNHHMFVLEQEEYTREGIKWDYVNFGLDLQPTIDLIESTGQHIGILSCLDEECIMPKATDLTFTNKLSAMWAGPIDDEDDDHPGRDKFEPSRFHQGFVIQHYAAKVEYRTDGWLEKNKDPLNDNLTKVLAASGENYVSTLFAEYAESPNPLGGANNLFTVGRKRAIKKGAFRTLAQRHKEQLSSLMGQLRATQPHFVRCIVPNTLKKPGRVDVPLVLDQLRCNGVLEGIRIARLGYPNRLPFVEFRQRYEVLTPGIIPRGYMDGREACRRMVNALELDDMIYRIGTSKIFFKAGVLAELEERRDALLYDLFSRLQAMSRMWVARRQMRKILNRAVAIRTIQRNARVYGELRDWPWWQLYTKVRPLLAATRNDEELRKREVELHLARERAEREKKEKEALETLRMSLESEKRRIEDQLAAERSLTLDKDALLERSKRREAELEEEIATLQGDLDLLDSQLDRALRLQKESEEKHESLRQAFDQAAEHLVRLEVEQKEWEARELEMSEQLSAADKEIENLRGDSEELQKVGEELKNLALQREEDIGRTKERSDLALQEAEAKLKAEAQNRELWKDKYDSMEKDARQSKEQLAEMARTANEYSAMLTKKEEQIADVEKQVNALTQEREKGLKEIVELQSDIDTLHAELNAERQDLAQEQALRNKLAGELDDLRTRLAAKTDEETMRREAQQSKEEELADLRIQFNRLHEELSESRRTALEAQSKLKVELEHASREHKNLLSSHKSLSDRAFGAQEAATKLQATVAELEKSKRGMESELQALRTRQHDVEDQIAEANRSKEALERQLVAAQAKYRDFEDVELQFERDRENFTRQIDAVKKQLDSESTKRSQLERSLSTQKQEVAKLKDRNAKLDRELNTALDNLKEREWEVKQLENRQDKTIVEHVHVLQEAKAVTDRQLQDTQLELEKARTYIKSLEKVKTRLAGEAEDLQQEKERGLRLREKNAKAQEEKTIKVLQDLEKERRAKSDLELNIRRLQADLKATQSQVGELSDQLQASQRSKDNLEAELERLVDETDANNSFAKLQRQYESRIATLEDQLSESDNARSTAVKIREHLERQHEEIRRLILHGKGDERDFQSRLLKELQLADEALNKEITARAKVSRSSAAHELPAYNPSTPKKRSGGSTVSTPSRIVENKQVAALKQQVQVLEVQMAASDRVRHHLEISIREMTSELEKSDGSRHFLQQYKARLVKENQKLSELLKDEAEARRAAETAQIDGVQAMWTKFQKTLADEREGYARLDESRKALLVQQRTVQAELDAQKAQNREFTQVKSRLQDEIREARQQAEQAKAEASDARKQMQTRGQDAEVKTAALSAAREELKTVIEAYKTKESGYVERIEATEIARAKAARGEAAARRALSDLEKQHEELAADRKKLQDRLRDYDKQIRDLKGKLSDGGRETSETDLLRQHLVEELEDARERHQKDLTDRDFTIDQTRKKYQAELAQLSEELQSQRDNLSRLREENRKLRSDYDELHLRLDDEVYNSGGWKKEKERMETKIRDLEKAYEASTGGQAEQQSQIVALHSQVRELRAVLDDAEADRALLQKARRALQAELETIKFDNTDSSKMSADAEFQRLHLRKQDLERSLEEQEDRVNNSLNRMKKAESYANDCQMELGKIRVENSELERLNASLEKQIKELNVRIIDLETRSYASPSRLSLGGSRKVDPKIEELSSQLQSSHKDKPDNSERQRTRLEDERKIYEAQMSHMRQAMDALHTEELNLQAGKRRAEREAADYRQKALNLERELESIKTRLDRPGSSSPRT